MTTRHYSPNKGLPAGLKATNLGDLITALKAALITGHETTPSADWELIYESAANNDDNSHRIVVRSKDLSSERRYFEIIDESAAGGKIICWEGWQNGAGREKRTEAFINNTYSDDKTLRIAANRSFCVFETSGSVSAFGDCQPHISTNEKSVILGNKVKPASSSLSYHSISSTNTNGYKYIRTKQVDLICRSFCKEYDGYGPRIATASAPHYAIYNGGDTEASHGGKSPVRQTELLAPRSNGYEFYGVLPIIIYTDNPVSMHNKQVTVNGKLKKVLYMRNIGTQWLPIWVDAS